ncbi:MAG: alkane 1-monooxygenase [Ahrensia sp.]|nr:alkane 1-monooxygenase [Ahrensia sp.]
MIFIAQTREGKEISYIDRKRYLWLLSVLNPSVPGLSALLIVFTQNVWFALLPIITYYVVFPILDIFVGEDPNNPPEEVVEQMAEDNYYRLLLFLSVPIFYFSFFATIYGAATQDMPLWASMALVFGAGTASGSGLTVAHELGHKQNIYDQWGGKIMSALTGYGHFNIEHNRGHHMHVATPEDAASARMGESIYAFVSREIPAVLRRGWALEAVRLERKGLPFFHWRNDILQGYAITILIAAALIAVCGLVALPFILFHHIVGWYQLSQANYIEHYGLKRARKENGKYEPCQPKHSWNTNHIVSNLALFHLQRHSDHHTNPIRPYQSLRNFDDIPHLPSGYPGCFALAAIPPLWRKVMDPKIHSWAGGDVTLTNVVPRLEERYREKFQRWSEDA